VAKADSHDRLSLLNRMDGRRFEVRLVAIPPGASEPTTAPSGRTPSSVLILKSATQPSPSRAERVASLFSGARARWRGPYDDLISEVCGFGPEVSVSPTDSYVSLLSKGKKFAILQVTADRLEVGIKKLKGVAPTQRLEPAGSWNSMVTHRVRVEQPGQIDEQLMGWLRGAYAKSQAAA
jgi:hypothetical protein